MNQGEKRRYLIEYLLGEQKRMQRVEIPVDAQGQRNLSILMLGSSFV
ncbi:hypothetical protein KGMB01110_06870 [Mediterraneibacter butyricigenes]|uniref:Uncharacterized protein n=1 Tax=Mediterraneibacter butyricigenes TaxID=2316025 RepID=A0A391NYM7_9FIRM|nr:hypothetical protein [Mediterraneibacter butyricigenes]GCA66251.1 hypothetical protein KGMB01110_06870 [Mediterraneibacter butyricigenes]